MNIEAHPVSGLARLRHAPSALLLGLMLLLAGCDSSSSPPPGAAPPSDTPEAKSKSLSDAEVRKIQERARQQNGEMSMQRRKRVLQELGEFKKWEVSTQRNGKVDEEVAKTAATGAYEKALKTAFSQPGLDLRFFSYVPKAITELRKIKPTPESCDIYCASPIEFSTLKDYLGDKLEETSDTDPDGHPRKWYREQEVSFGVVDGKVTVVRLNLAVRAHDWQQIGVPR